MAARMKEQSRRGSQSMQSIFGPEPYARGVRPAASPVTSHDGAEAVYHVCSCFPVRCVDSSVSDEGKARLPLQDADVALSRRCQNQYG